MIESYAARADDPEVTATVTALLLRDWGRAAALPTPDGRAGAEAHAGTVLAMLAAGASQAEVSGYLRRVEEAAWGAPHTAGRERWAIADAAWRAIRGLPPTPVPPAERGPQV